MIASIGMGTIVPEFRELLHAKSVPENTRLLEPADLQRSGRRMRCHGSRIAGPRLDFQVSILR